MNPTALLTHEALSFLALLTLELLGIYLAVVFLVETLQHRLGPSRIQRLLGRDTGPKQFLAAATLGAITPFCSCSTVPLVAGMNRVGVPWPTLGAFLIISPLVNPALFALIWTFVGITYAGLYVAASLLIAIFVGATIAHTGWDIHPTEHDTLHPTQPEQDDDGWRLKQAFHEALSSTLKLAPIFIAAGLIGTALRYWIGTAWIETLLAATGWWTIPLAAIVGIPVYASTAVLLPLGALLLDQGTGLGVVTAFLMGATGFSIPEGIMLKEIIGTQRLAVLTGAFAVAVILAGYGFQLVLG